MKYYQLVNLLLIVKIKEKLAFCLNTTKKGHEAIDINTLTFVALHELAHVATVEVGHTENFWRNFKFLLHEAEEIGIYNVVDYVKNLNNIAVCK